MTDLSLPSTQVANPARIGGETALVRSIGTFGVILFGVACISLSASGMIPIGVISGLWPGINLVSLLTVAMLVSVIRTYLFAAIGSVAPYSGADYVLSTRVLSGPVGFAASFTFVVFGCWVIGASVAAIPKIVLPAFMQILSVVANGDTMLQIARYTATLQGTVVIGTVLLVLGYLLTILPTRTIHSMLFGGFVLGLLAWGTLYFQLGTASKGSFQSAWDQFMGMGSYSAQTNQALVLSWQFVNDRGLITMAALTLGLWIFFGNTTPVHFAGEVKKPERNLLLGGWASLLITWAVFIGGIYLAQRVVPADWMSAESYLSLSSYEGQTMPWIFFYAAILRPNVLLLLVVMIAWIYTLINLVQAYFFFSSRILLAWVKDGLLPGWVGFVHPTMHSPVVAVLLVAIFSQVGLVEVARIGITSVQMSFVFILLSTQIVPLLAITLLPFLKKDWYEKAPHFVQYKLGPLPVITLVGGIMIAISLAVLVASVMFPVQQGPTLTTNLSYLVIIFVVGVIWYTVRRSYLNRQGVDLKKRLSQMPQE